MFFTTVYVLISLAFVAFMVYAVSEIMSERQAEREMLEMYDHVCMHPSCVAKRAGRETAHQIRVNTEPFTEITQGPVG